MDINHRDIIQTLAALPTDQLGRSRSAAGQAAISKGITGPRMEGGVLAPEVKSGIAAEVQGVWDQMKGALDAADAERKRLGDETAETKQAIERIEADLEAKMDALEAKGRRLAETAAERQRNGIVLTDEQKASREAFLSYVRKGERGMSPEQLKALATDVDAEGGYLMPENLSPVIREKLVQFSAVRDLATIETITQGNDFQFPKENGAFSAGWVTERAARPETTAGTLAVDTIVAHELYANPLASQRMLEDTGYDIEGYIARKTGEAIGKLEGTGFMTGSGSGQPMGAITTGNGVTTRTSAVSVTVSGDDILDLLFDIPSEYADDIVLLLNRDTVRALRKQKGSDGQYIWSPGFGGQPATLFDTPYREDAAMPVVAAGARAVIAANWKEFYTILDRKGVNTLRDPFSSKPFVEFYTTKRVGGKPTNTDAARILVVKA